MSILQIELPDEQWQIISAQARALGFESNGEYLLSVVQKLAGKESLYPSGDHPTPEQLERQQQLLLESLDGEPEVADDAWWAKLQADVEAQVADKIGAGQKA